MSPHHTHSPPPLDEQRGQMWGFNGSKSSGPVSMLASREELLTKPQLLTEIVKDNYFCRKKRSCPKSLSELSYSQSFAILFVCEVIFYGLWSFMYPGKIKSFCLRNYRYQEVLISRFHEVLISLPDLFPGIPWRPQKSSVTANYSSVPTW